MNGMSLQCRDSKPRWHVSAGMVECDSLRLNEKVTRVLRGCAPACIACIGLVLAGCAKPVEHVQAGGAVFVDGEPAAGLQVIFHPQDIQGGTVASGITNEEGFFTLLSGLEAGVLPGNYRVVAIWPDPSVKPTEVEVMMGTAEPGPDLLGGRYSSLQSSTLTAEIHAGSMVIPPFELTTSDN